MPNRRKRRSHDEDELEGDRPRAPGPRGPEPVAPEHAQVQALQRSAGNAAVAQLLEPGRLSVQRGQPDAASIEAGTRPTIHAANVSFYALPYVRSAITANGTRRNEEARHLMTTFHRTGRKSHELRDAIEVLRGAAMSGGPGAVDAIEAAGKAISGGLKGRRGDQLKAAIDKYNEATPAAAAGVDELAAASADVIAATKELEQATNAGQLAESRKAETKASADVASIKAEMAEARQFTDAIIGTAISALKGEWTDAALKVGSLVGKHVFGVDVSGSKPEDFAVSSGKAMAGEAVEQHDYFTGRLERATARLAGIRARIQTLEDRNVLLEVEKAAKKLEAAVSRGKAAAKRLESLATAARNAHQNLYTELNKLGPAGRAAADALDERLGIVDEAHRAARLADEYEGMLLVLGDEAGKLRGQYDLYAALVRANKDWIGDVTGDIVSRAESNIGTCDQLIWWGKGELSGLGDVRAYLSEASFMESYDKGMRTALEQSANPGMPMP